MFFKTLKYGFAAFVCLALVSISTGCSTTVEAQQSRFDRAIDSLEIVGTKQPMKKADITAKVSSFKAERDKIMAGTGDQKAEMARLASRVESYTSKLAPTMATGTTTAAPGTKLAKPTMTPPPGKGAAPGIATAPGAIPNKMGNSGTLKPTLGNPGAVPGTLGATTSKLGAPGATPGKLGAPGVMPGKLGAPSAMPGKLGAPGAMPGKLGAPGAMPGKLGAPGAMPVKVGNTATATRSVGVYLLNSGRNKVKVIRLIREQTGLGLLESKKIADTPNSAVRVGLTRAQANDLRSQLVSLGAQVVIR